MENEKCFCCGEKLDVDAGVYVYLHEDIEYYFCPATRSTCMYRWMKENVCPPG